MNENKKTKDHRKSNAKPRRSSNNRQASSSAQSKETSFFVKLNRILTKVLFVILLVLGFSIYKFITAFQGLQDPSASMVLESSDIGDENDWYDPEDSPGDYPDWEQDPQDDSEDWEAPSSADSDEDDEEESETEESSEEDLESSEKPEPSESSVESEDSEDSESSEETERSEEPEESEDSDLSGDSEESEESLPEAGTSFPEESAWIPDPLPSAVTTQLREELASAFYETVPSSDAFYLSDSPSYCQSMSIEGMYYTGIAYDLYRYSYELCDGRLFVTLTGDGTIREIYDIETGMQLGSYAIDEMNTLLTGCLENGRSYLIDMDLTLRIYNENGNLEQYMTYAALEGISRQSISLITVTQDGDYLCVRQAGSPSFTFIQVDDGSSFTLFIENAPISLGLLENADDLVLTDYRSTLLTIDPDNRDWDLHWIESPFVLYSDGLLYDISSKSVSVYNRDHDLCTFRSIWNHETILGARGGLIITSLDRNGDYLNDSLHFYDFNRNEYRELILPEGYGVYNVLFPGSGRLLLCYNHGDSDGFAFVELNDLPWIGDLDPYFSSVDCLSSETRDLANRIYDQFGVSVFYGDEGDDFDLSDYRGSVCMDGLQNYEAVLNVYNLLRLFPTNMLRECYEGFCDGLNLYLCADITGMADSGLSFAGGVSNQVGDHLILALDIYEPYLFNLPHELSHLFDYRIRRHFWMQNEELDDYWAALSPDGAFLYSYSGYEALDYYILGYADPEDVYFTRNYSRTMPGEDRATLFETMFDHPEYDCHPDLYVGHLMDKAKTYARLLRETFPSCQNAGRLYWEIGLE